MVTEITKNNIKNLSIILSGLNEEQKLEKCYLLGFIDGMDFKKNINIKEIKENE